MPRHTHEPVVVQLADHPAFERHDDAARIGRLMFTLRRLRHRDIEDLEEWLRVHGMM